MKKKLSKKTATAIAAVVAAVTVVAAAVALYLDCTADSKIETIKYNGQTYVRIENFKSKNHFEYNTDTIKILFNGTAKATGKVEYEEKEISVSLNPTDVNDTALVIKPKIGKTYHCFIKESYDLEGLVLSSYNMKKMYLLDGDKEIAFEITKDKFKTVTDSIKSYDTDSKGTDVTHCKSPDEIYTVACEYENSPIVYYLCRAAFDENGDLGVCKFGEDIYTGTPLVKIENNNLFI